MASPRFSSPPHKGAARPRRTFTLAQANSTLPLVKRIVRDIVDAHQRISQAQQRMEKAASARDAAAIQLEMEGDLDRLRDYLEELSAVGGQLKDAELGLIDFLGRHQGREIFLCWKLGEERIEYWHELHAGFAGRLPTSLLEETA